MGYRPRSQSRRLRKPPLVLLQRPQRPVRGDREVSRRPTDLGAGDEGYLRREEPAVVAPPVPRADRRRQPDRPATRGQPRPDDGPGPRRRPRGSSIPSYERVRRSVSGPERSGRAPRPPDAADLGPRERRPEYGRPPRRLVFPRGPHGRTRGRGLPVLRPDPGARRRHPRDPERV